MNIWAILVSMVFYAWFGTLWYSKLMFGKLWMKFLGVKEEELSMKPKDYIFAILSGVLGTVLLAIIFEVGGPTYGVLSGFLYGLLVAGLVFTTSSSQVVFSGKKWQSWLIDAGYHATALIIVGIVLGAWA